MQKKKKEAEGCKASHEKKKKKIYASQWRLTTATNVDYGMKIEERRTGCRFLLLHLAHLRSIHKLHSSDHHTFSSCATELSHSNCANLHEFTCPPMMRPTCFLVRSNYTSSA